MTKMSQANILRAIKYKKSKSAEPKQQNPKINKNSRKQQGTHEKLTENDTNHASDAEVRKITGCQERKENANKEGAKKRREKTKLCQKKSQPAKERSADVTPEANVTSTYRAFPL